MSAIRIPLDVINVEKPCPVSWDTMRGDDRVRFCGECSLHVYNLSALTRPQAEALVNGHEPGRRMCVRFFRREDGTVITQDCGGGIRAAGRRAARWTAAAAGAMLCAMLSPLGLRGFVERAGNGVTVTAAPPVAVPQPTLGVMAVAGELVCPPPAPQELRGKLMMMPIQGDMVVPATQPTTQPVSK